MCIDLDLGSSVHLPAIAKYLRCGYNNDIKEPCTDTILTTLNGIINNIGYQNHLITEINASVDANDFETAYQLAKEVKNIEQLTGIGSAIDTYIRNREWEHECQLNTVYTKSRC